MNGLTVPTWLEGAGRAAGRATRAAETGLRLAGPARALHRLGERARHGVRWAAEHTGLPPFLVGVVIGAVLLVIGVRFAKRSARVALELVVAAALVVLAAKLGWIRW